TKPAPQQEQQVILLVNVGMLQERIDVRLVVFLRLLLDHFRNVGPVEKAWIRRSLPVAFLFQLGPIPRQERSQITQLVLVGPVLRTRDADPQVLTHPSNERENVFTTDFVDELFPAGLLKISESVIIHLDAVLLPVQCTQLVNEFRSGIREANASVGIWEGL